VLDCTIIHIQLVKSPTVDEAT